MIALHRLGFAKTDETCQKKVRRIKINHFCTGRIHTKISSQVTRFYENNKCNLTTNSVATLIWLGAAWLVRGGNGADMTLPNHSRRPAKMKEQVVQDDQRGFQKKIV